jgi:hypothetical protein
MKLGLQLDVRILDKSSWRGKFRPQARHRGQELDVTVQVDALMLGRKLSQQPELVTDRHRMSELSQFLFLFLT